jgi:acetyl/propionyl-CoA carboxylase alpha subunit
MPATGMAIPEQMKPAPIAAEMQQQPQRQTGEQLSNMAEQQQTTRDEMSVSQAPVINNISSGGGGGGMQSVPQSSAANAPIASVRNEENAFVRMQNMMALQAMS